jgi:hypothetical protein
MDAYSVVALSVNVKLVEKIAKSHDGKVMVVKVMSHKRILGIALMADKIRYPNKLIKGFPKDISVDATVGVGVGIPMTSI